MTKILILGNAPLPFETEKKLYGTNIRTWNIAEPLWQDKHEICLVCSRIKDTYYNEKKLARIIKTKKDNLTYYALEESIFEKGQFLQKIHDEFQPDCLVGVNTHPAFHAVRIKTNKPIWADLNGSVIAEAQAKAYVYNDNTYLNYSWHDEKSVLEKADIFSTVSQAQKYALVGELGITGRLNRFTFGYEFVHYIPTGIEDREYQQQKEVMRNRLVSKKDFVILWSGGYNTWTDVDTLFSALKLAIKENSRIKFVSLGGAITGHDEITYYRFLKMIKQTKLSGNFIFTGWVPTKEVPNYYFESDVGINIDKFNYETLLGARTRINDMLKAGLPVLTSLGTEVSYLVQSKRLGWTYPIGDAKSLAETILFLADNKRLLKEYGQRGKRYVFRHLTFAKTTLPLREWVKNPRPAPDKEKKLSLYALYPKSKFEKYLTYIRTEGLLKANKKVFAYLVRKTKRFLPKR